MRKILLASTALAAMTVSALAADEIAAPAAAGWSGYYLGAVGAYEYGAEKYSERSIGAESLLGDMSGFVGGITAGANHQNGNAVIGIEGDYSFGSIDGIAQGNPPFGCGSGCGLEVENFASLRARLGYSFGQTLAYGTAGWGFANAVASVQGLGTLGEDHLTGPVWGVGVEHLFAGKWSAKLEYLHVDLGRLEIPTSCNTQCYSDVGFESIRFGLNYHF